jgi:anti-anti-sigma regulatory factor
MAYHQAAATGAELRLAVQASSVRRVMELTGLFRLMNAYPSVAAALQAEPDTSQA